MVGHWTSQQLADNNVWTLELADDNRQKQQAQNDNGIFVCLSVHISNHYNKELSPLVRIWPIIDFGQGTSLVLVYDHYILLKKFINLMKFESYDDDFLSMRLVMASIIIWLEFMKKKMFFSSNLQKKFKENSLIFMRLLYRNADERTSIGIDNILHKTSKVSLPINLINNLDRSDLTQNRNIAANFSCHWAM